MSYNAFLNKNIKALEKFNNKDILAGMGELLTEKQKDWARTKLRTETIFLLKAWLESEE
ncbi:MAG: hypothetical protein V1686_00640 [Patescibacteria group bacterium]